MDPCETRIIGTFGDLLEEAQRPEQSAINRGTLYLDRTSFKTTTGVDDDSKRGAWALIFPMKIV